MIYAHQQEAIDYISEKFKRDKDVEALLLSGSIAHGFNNENSDIDINIVVSNEIYNEKGHALTYFEEADNFYKGGYFDGKYITLDYLSLVFQRGNEPTKFALHDCKILFDKTGKVGGLLKEIGIYNSKTKNHNIIRFLSQLDAWKWYCDEALKKSDPYLLDLAVSKLILFAGRLILLENEMFFPYHKWFMRVLKSAKSKPENLILTIEELLKNKTQDNVYKLYELVKNYKDWTNGEKYSWPSNFLHDIETVWMRDNEFIENI